MPKKVASKSRNNIGRTGARPVRPTRRVPRIEVRASSVHGTGVYATEPIARGQRIIEYTGEHISWKQAQRRHPHDPNNPNHTFYFTLDDGDVIDATYGGNDSRWINHSCQPNCQTRERKGRIFVHARRGIKAGEELFYDYRLVIDEPHTKKRKKDFECHCGTTKCRGTMLEPK
jgi:SET domain-containing protein